MKAFLCCASLLLSLILTIGNAHADSALRSAVSDYLAKHSAHSPPAFKTFPYDLNDDGRLDAIVLLTAGWCGSGGCTMLVFRGSQEGYAFVSKSTITEEPIAVLPETNHGWHTLIVLSGGTGKVLMKFDGKKYPFNPSMQRKASSKEIRQAKVLTEAKNSAE